MATPDTSSPLDRLSAYRPVLDRLIFGVALVGVLVVAHLGIQQERGFAQGCFGFGAEASAASNFDCGAVLASAASTFLGVSNVVWGFVFYGAIAALTLAAAFVMASSRRTLKMARLGLIGFGVLYTLRLLYIQFFQLDALCALCLTSAALVGTLLTLQALELFRAPSEAVARQREVPRARRKREASVLAVAAVVVVLVAGADAFYFGGQPASAAVAEGRPDAAASTPGRTASAEAPAIPDSLQIADGCYYDPEKSATDPSQLVSMGDPIKGDASAGVTVFEYFDPNCPHCATFHPVMEDLRAEYGDQARFVYKPVPLWQYSVPQIEALYAAQQEGKFDAMMEAQFANQQRGGLNEQQLQQIAQEIGMDPGVLMGRLRNGVFSQKVDQERQQAVEIGLNSTPTVLINGRFVAQRSRNPRCLGLMIEAAAQEGGAAAES